MEHVALRAFTCKKNASTKQKSAKKVVNSDFSRVLTFDTETTADEFLNLKFGSFTVHERDIYQYAGLFWDERHVSQKEYAVLKSFSEENNIRLFSLQEFIKIFYYELYEKKILCIGYNINFDLSRIILDYGYGRYSGKDGFSFKLTEDTTYPRLRIKHLNGRSFDVEFTRAKGKYRKDKTFKGHFLDVCNLACTLTDEKSLSLERACDIFDTPIKKKAVEKHGIITPKYIQYNIDDTQATYQVFKKVRAECEKYQLDIQMTDIYSAASIGKQALRQCDIKSFLVQNPDFSNPILGKVMSAYYGGRCECRIRKKPVKITVLDFFSMYPTITLLLGLWDYVIADKIRYEEIIDAKDRPNKAKHTLNSEAICTIDTTDTLNTKNDLNSICSIQEFIDTYDISKALDKDLWQKMNVLIEVEPDNDILPIRSKYGEKDSYNIGINYVSYKGSLYFFFPDVLASKLLTGKSPTIKKAISFIPEGTQENLTETEIYGVHVNPKEDNLIKLLVERRQEIKQCMKRVTKDSHEYDVLDAQQRALKILNNSTTYGIYIEMHPKEKEKLDVFSTEEFETEGTFESTGTFFNPIIGANITAGARLLLAIAEGFVRDKGEVHAYMDTDSIFVPPHLANELSHRFDSLNPYDFNKPILEIEEGMENIWFYGISSKRYCLFRIVGNKIIIPEGKKLFYKLHGLGHITNPFSREQKDGDKWHKRLWEDILKVHFYPEELPDVLEKYENYAVISKLAVSTGTILKRFNKMNEGKPFDKQIKPFNFMLVGNGTKVNEDGEKVKPIAPYNKNPQIAAEKPFIDYSTGNIFCGREYWKPLSDVFLEYIDHPEAKFDGDTGILKRRHLKPKGCVYIGKEANKVEMQELEGNRVETYYDIGKLQEYILSLTPAEAREIGIKHRSTLKKLKDRVKRRGF